MPISEASKGVSGADGFIEVKPLARNQGGQAAQDRGSGQGNAAEGGGGVQHHVDGLAAASGAAPPQAMDVGDGDEGDQLPAEELPPSEEDLRGFWEAAKDMLAFTKRQGYPEDHPVRRNAQRHVEETLAEWRAAAPPKALHTRMGFAEEALRRAKKAQAKAEQDLDDLDRQYEADRQRLVQDLCEARQKTRERVQKLADLSKEAAEEYHGDMGTDDAKLLRGVFQTLDAQVGPAVEAALGRTERGSEQFGMLQEALRSVATIHAALGVAAGGSAADYFDLAAGDGACDAPAEPNAAADASGAGGSADMDTSDAGAPRWMDAKRGGQPDPASSTGAQHPRWKKYRGEGDGGAAPPPRHEEGATGDQQQQQHQHQQQQLQQHAGSGPAVAGQADEDEFAPRRAQIIAQAQFDGVEAPVEYLQQLCPEALEEWAREHLL